MNPPEATIVQPRAEVCPVAEKVRNAASRQRRFRQSEKGKAAYSARLQARREDTKRRRNERWERLNEYRGLDPFGRYSGHSKTGVPRAADMKRRVSE